MSPVHISTELLLALDALLAEESVTGAARRLARTQPAVSRALARLRRHFGDPLFVRTAHGLRPTRRARELALPARRVLAELEALGGAGRGFDPRAARRRFALAGLDYAQLVAFAPLGAALAREAPGVDLAIRAWSPDAERDVEAGTLDLLVGPEQPTAAGLMWTPLWSDRYVCVAWRGRRVRRLSAAAFAALDHVLVAPRERPGGPLDAVLARHGLRRRIVVQVPTFLIAPSFLVGTARVATIPARIAELLVKSHPLHMFPPPVAIPDFTIGAAWHEIHRGDAGHRWLRTRLAALCA
ncbi:MAG TPA: LysR family transcriptional regulator [Kofleriaceae bacterium]|nr:LysR family transcriptional regulator [Kofleriaceae bacterium]